MEVLQARNRPHQAATVGRVAVGAVDDLFDPDCGERGNARAGGGEHAFDPVEVGREQARVETRRDPVQGPGAWPALERPDEQARAFLADVVGVVGVAEDGQLALPALQLPDCVGDDVVVLEGDDRQIDSGEAGDLRGPLTGRVHDDLRANRAPGRREPPGGAIALDPGHRRPPHDLRAGSGHESPRQARRVDVPVRRQVGGRQDPRRVHQRVELGETLRADDLDRDAGDLAHRPPVTELVEPVGGRRQADAAAGVPVDRLARLGLEPRVQLDAGAQQPHQVIARVELRAETGGVPGRTARQLVLLEQDDVAPSQLRQVVGKAATGNAAADDRDLGFRRHLWDHRGGTRRRQP